MRLARGVLQFGALAVVLAVLPFKAFDLDRFFITKELVLHLTATISAVLLLVNRRKLELTRVDTFLAGYLALSALSALFASNWWLAERALAISFSSAAVFWGTRAIARADHGEALLSVLTLAIVVSAITALLQVYGLQTEYFSLNRAPGGTLGNRNFVAHLAAIGVPVLLLRTLTVKNPWSVIGGAVGTACIAAILFLTRSRAAWLALIACTVIVVFAIIAAWRRWREAEVGGRAVLLAVSAGVGILLAAVIPNRLNWKSDSPYLDSVRGVVNYREGSGRGRLIQYRNSAHMAMAHPVLGVGPGNWSVQYPHYAAANDPSLDQEGRMTSNPWPSSDWVAMLSERGVLATVCFLFVFFGIAVSALLALSEAENLEQLVPPLILLATLAAAAVVGAFDAVLLLPAPAFMVWALLGALMPFAQPRATILLSDGRRLFLIGAIIFFGGIAIVRSAGQIRAMALFTPDGKVAEMESAARFDPGSYRIQIRLAEAYARRGRCEPVREYAGHAKALFPNAPEPKRLLAACGKRQR